MGYIKWAPVPFLDILMLALTLFMCWIMLGTRAKVADPARTEERHQELVRLLSKPHCSAA